jgi:hypothetical protein
MRGTFLYNTMDLKKISVGAKKYEAKDVLLIKSNVV